MTAVDWILTEKSSRTFCSPRWFGAMRRHLCDEKTSLCEELFWRGNMRFPCCSVLQENFVKEFEGIISFLNSRVTSLDVW